MRPSWFFNKLGFRNLLIVDDLGWPERDSDRTFRWTLLLSVVHGIEVLISYTTVWDSVREEVSGWESIQACLSFRKIVLQITLHFLSVPFSSEEPDFALLSWVSCRLSGWCLFCLFWCSISCTSDRSGYFPFVSLFSTEGCSVTWMNFNSLSMGTAMKAVSNCWWKLYDFWIV